MIGDLPDTKLTPREDLVVEASKKFSRQYETFHNFLFQIGIEFPQFSAVYIIELLVYWRSLSSLPFLLQENLHSRTSGLVQVSRYI